jgi:hypothetical protein
MLISLLLLAAADAALPKSRPILGPIKTFGDWVVACDNVRACEMTSLIAETESPDGSDSGAAFSIARGGGPADGFVLDVSGNGDVAGAVSVRVDGKTIADGVVAKDVMTLAGNAAARIVAAMANGKRLTLTDKAGKEVAHASLDGSSAALRLIDAEQRRAGTVTAAVARGTKPATGVPIPPPLPRVTYVAPSGVAAPITPALRKAMIAASGCDTEDVNTSDPVTGHALGGGRTLVLLPCGAGAYNFSSVPFVLTGGKAALARFDSPTGWTNEADDKPMLVNADWDAKSARLQSYAKGRGLGDCGSAETYVWDGAMFRLIQATQMGECRGSVNWLTIWRATPVR